ncbi:MAG: thioredoxin [Planctomycetota bacterium]
MAGSKTTIVGTDDNFEAEVLQSELPVLVDFWAPWCGPCRMVGPIVEELADLYSGRLKVVKVNVDESPGVAGSFGIRSIPTLTLFQGGEAVNGLVGAVPRAKLEELVRRVIGEGAAAAATG